MPPTDHPFDIAVGLARVEGKLDAFLSMQSLQEKRISALEEEVHVISHDVTTIKATKAQGSSWVATGFSIVGLLIAGLALFFGVSP